MWHSMKIRRDGGSRGPRRSVTDRMLVPLIWIAVFHVLMFADWRQSERRELDRRYAIATVEDTTLMRFSPDSRRIVWSGFDGSVAIYEPVSMEQQRVTRLGRVGDLPVCSAFSEDGKWLYCGGAADGSLALVSVEQPGEILRVAAPPGDQGLVAWLAVAPAGQSLRPPDLRDFDLGPILGFRFRL